jgi:hypothetical protein
MQCCWNIFDCVWSNVDYESIFFNYKFYEIAVQIKHLPWKLASELRNLVSVKHTGCYRLSSEEVWKIHINNFFLTIECWNNILDIGGWIKYMIKSNFTCFFSFFKNKAAKELQKIYVTYIIFPLFSTAPKGVSK